MRRPSIQLWFLPDLFPSLPTQLEDVAADSGPTAARRNPSVIVTSISSPSILHSPPGFHGSLKLARTNSPVTREPLDVARLEIAVLP